MRRFNECEQRNKIDTSVLSILCLLHVALPKSNSMRLLRMGLGGAVESTRRLSRRSPSRLILHGAMSAVKRKGENFKQGILQSIGKSLRNTLRVSEREIPDTKSVTECLRIMELPQSGTKRHWRRRMGTVPFAHQRRGLLLGAFSLWITTMFPVKQEVFCAPDATYLLASSKPLQIGPNVLGRILHFTGEA